jgi:hypothetical protein
VSEAYGGHYANVTAATATHGTTNAYTHGGCRCGPCRDAWADYMRGRRARVRLPHGDRRHGTINAYTNWACRCRLCQDAQRDRQRVWRAGRA